MGCLRLFSAGFVTPQAISAALDISSVQTKVRNEVGVVASGRSRSVRAAVISLSRHVQPCHLVPWI